MKLGIMQPYFFPYIGYWQLLNAVDEYVVYDDVNFIKGGWINRNRILVGNEIKYFNVPMIGASSYKKINEIEVDMNPGIRNKLIRTIEINYFKAPYYDKAFEVFRKVVTQEESNLARYLYYSIEAICEYLGITTKLLISSEINKNNCLKGEDKVLQICKILNASEYYNAIGGKELYSKENFLHDGIELKFVKTSDGVPNLSILDVMMNNSIGEIRNMLQDYELQ